MRFDIPALALTAGIIWGGCILFVEIANLAWPGYGVAFLELVASIYPGYQPGGGLGEFVVGALYGLVDGAIGGALFGWLYNTLAATLGGRTP